MDGRDATKVAVSRRTMLRWSGSAGMLAVAASITQACVAPGTDDPGADANGVVLPAGFSSRIIARAGEKVLGTPFEFRAFPDGAATFVDAAVAGGWYLVVNHEIPLSGGVSSIRFAPDGRIVEARSICSDTGLNCAGGATPWGTWLTCEEFDRGHVWECDPTGAVPAQRRRAMGAFSHEAAAVASDGRVYLTEDRPDGAFYRFTPVAPGDLSSGLLEIATGDAHEGPVTWAEVPDPDPSILEPSCRRQVAGTLHFDGGEGIATSGDLVWFTTKGDDRIWQYEVPTGQLTLRYQAGGPGVLSGVDNLWFDSPSGGLLVAEDGGDMEVVLLGTDDVASSVVRLPDQDHSEITGPCFSPDGQRLYFSSQRAQTGDLGLPLGITYEITGPFDQLLGRV
ncbi:MAG: alkaline phosphatase PhoX [Microthrixaceae bacterium]